MVTTARARGREALVNRSEISDCEGARPQLSPVAISVRASPSWKIEPAKPVKTVIRLQKNRPMAMTLRRLQRSATQAMGIPMMA